MKVRETTITAERHALTRMGRAASIDYMRGGKRYRHDFNKSSPVHIFHTGRGPDSFIVIGPVSVTANDQIGD